MKLVNPFIDDQTALRIVLNDLEYCNRLTNKAKDHDLCGHFELENKQLNIVPNYLNYLVLPRTYFANGTCYFNAKVPQRLGITPYIIHNNCIIGHDSKVARFKLYNLWLVPNPLDFTFNNEILFIITENVLLKGHTEIITCLSIDPDESTLYTSSYDKTIICYQADEIVERMKHEIQLKVKSIYLNKRGGVWSMVWNKKQKQCFEIDNSEQKNLQIDYSTQKLDPEYSCLTAGHDKQIRIWESTKEEKWHDFKLLKGHWGVINQLLVFDNLVFSASDDNTIRCWDLKSEKKKLTYFGPTSWVSSICIGHAALFASSHDGLIYAWDKSNARLMQIYKGHNGWVRKIILNDKYIISGSSDGTIKEWDIFSGDCIRTLKNAHKFGINCLELILIPETDSYHLYSAGDDGFIRVWDYKTLRCLCEYRGHDGIISSLIIWKTFLITGGYDKTVRIWLLYHEQLKS